MRLQQIIKTGNTIHKSLPECFINHVPCYMLVFYHMKNKNNQKIRYSTQPQSAESIWNCAIITVLDVSEC